MQTEVRPWHIVIVVAVMAALGWFVWPTPWNTQTFENHTVRQHRFSGEVQIKTDDGWTTRNQIKD